MLLSLYNYLNCIAHTIVLIAYFQVFPAIQSFQEHGVEFIDGTIESFDVVILATGYKSNVPYWLKV